jgi:protein-S-isoprenylcysteine O-methyltransferase Ste14
MAKRKWNSNLGIKRSAMREDLIFFAIPAIIVFFVGLLFCSRDGFTGFWVTVWSLIRQPQTFLAFPLHRAIGLVLIVLGFVFLLAGQITLGRNHTSLVAIREDHRLITHGVYRFTRNPMYLGVILIIVVGIPVYAPSLYGFLILLLLVPIILNRIRMEEGLLTKEFGEVYLAYKKSTRKLIPFIY